MQVFWGGVVCPSLPLEMVADVIVTKLSNCTYAPLSYVPLLFVCYMAAVDWIVITPTFPI